MGELVLLKRQNNLEIPVTTSTLIAERTKNTHHAIQVLISKFENELYKFGKVSFQMRASNKNQQEKIYYLNEQQATLLVTFMRNNENVINFKVELVKQFYEMKQLLLEKHTAEWQEARAIGKIYTKELNDIIKEFTEYASLQGSSKSDMYYIHFAKLVNRSIGAANGQRDFTSKRQLRNQTFVMELIESTVREGINKQIYYKEIFSNCKNRISGFLEYIPLLKIAQ